jgi:hypothetical protein
MTILWLAEKINNERGMKRIKYGGKRSEEWRHKKKYFPPLNYNGISNKDRID